MSCPLPVCRLPTRQTMIIQRCQELCYAGKCSADSLARREVAMKYTVLIEESDEGFAVSVPGLPGCHSQGDTEAEASANIVDAIRENLDVIQELAQLMGPSWPRSRCSYAPIAGRQPPRRSSCAGDDRLPGRTP